MMFILTIGVSGSGKSTWAHAATSDKTTIISRDAVRAMMVGYPEGNLWDHWDFSREKEVTAFCDQQLQHFLNQGKYDTIIFDDTNLNKKFREEKVKQLSRYGKVYFMEFPISLEEAIERDQHRVNRVGKAVIEKQYQQWVQYIEGIQHGNSNQYSNDDQCPGRISSN